MLQVIGATSSLTRWVIRPLVLMGALVAIGPKRPAVAQGCDVLYGVVCVPGCSIPGAATPQSLAMYYNYCTSGWDYVPNGCCQTC
jgi:hypothetical protein